MSQAEKWTGRAGNCCLRGSSRGTSANATKHLPTAPKKRLFPRRNLYNIGMPSDPQSTSEIASPAVRLTAPEMSALIGAQECEIIRLRRQVAWFQRQFFGQKSERRTPEPEDFQGTLGEAFDVVPDDVAQATRPGSRRTSAHLRTRTRISSMATMTRRFSLTNRWCRSRSLLLPMTRRRDWTSFIAGMIIDKFAYHQPLYRQHVRVLANAAY